VCVCVCLCVFVCSALLTVWSRFGGESVQQVALFCVCVCIRCVLEDLEEVWDSECAAGGFVLCVCCVCAACGQFGVSLE